MFKKVENSFSVFGIQTNKLYLQPVFRREKEMPSRSEVIFDRNVVEFVTVAAEFCSYLERSEGVSRNEFVDTLLKLLPLLYLKGTMLPACSLIDEEEGLERFVTEDEYEVLRLTLADVMGRRDDYLDVFLADMKYSDTPIRKTISEDLADIWQDIKNFVCLFKTGVNQTMNDALVECRENFATYWGQTLVNTLRALHEVKYNLDDEDIEE